MSRYKKSEPTHIADSLRDLFTDLGHDKKIKQYRVIQHWEEIVGTNISRVASAERVSDGILYIRVKSMSWRTELMFQKQQIMKKIQTFAGNNVIRDIRFH